MAACSPSFSEQVSLVASVFMNINEIHENMKSTSECSQHMKSTYENQAQITKMAKYFYFASYKIINLP